LWKYHDFIDKNKNIYIINRSDGLDRLQIRGFQPLGNGDLRFLTNFSCDLYENYVSMGDYTPSHDSLIFSTTITKRNNYSSFSYFYSNY